MIENSNLVFYRCLGIDAPSGLIEGAVIVPVVDALGITICRMVASNSAGAIFLLLTINDGLDNLAPSGEHLSVVSRLQAFDGVDYDRLRCAIDTGDAAAAIALGNLITLSRQQIWNGATYDRLRAASAAIQALATKVGVLAVAKIGDWAVHSDPAAATQATITRAAGAAGVRHICTSISATFSAGATAGAATKVYLRDGASGAGTILWSGSLAAPIGDVRAITISDLSIVGSAATAMTLEFAAAGALTTLQNVSLTGYDTI